MAKRLNELLVVFTVNTCGYGGQDTGEGEREASLLSWQVIDVAKVQVGHQLEYYYPFGVYSPLQI